MIKITNGISYTQEPLQFIRKKLLAQRNANLYNKIIAQFSTHTPLKNRLSFETQPKQDPKNILANSSYAQTKLKITDCQGPL